MAGMQQGRPGPRRGRPGGSQPLSRLVELSPQLDVLVDDERFRQGLEALDVDEVAVNALEMTESLSRYNHFHRFERLMWRQKLTRGGGRGRQWEESEGKFRGRIPEGRQAYRSAFEATDRIAELVDQAGLVPVVEDHIAPMLAYLDDREHPFTEALESYFLAVGCSAEMVDEFRHGFRSTDYQFFRAIPGGWRGVREFSRKGVEAQMEILDETERNGFRYLRGECGPPEWAIIAQKILAAAGISLSAWVIVAIIASLLVTLVAICVAAPAGSWLRRQCERLSVLLPIFRF